MAKVLSGIQPTGDVHLGNYIGALRQWRPEEGNLYPVVDLHSLTDAFDPETLHKRILELASLLLALGLGSPSLVFVQSQVPAHAELTWLLTCLSRTGELSRMTQYKSKGRGVPSAPTGLFMYPVLMAADILLYQTQEVPVGEDQKQHVELTRDLAQRFNSAFGPVFTLPEPVIPKLGGRVASLTRPTEKMSKSDPDPNSKVLMTDPDDAIRKKIGSAVTDSGREVYPDEKDKAGITNLLEIASALSGEDVDAIAARYRTAGYGAFKRAVADIVIATIGPIRDRATAIREDSEGIARVLAWGRDRALAEAAPTLRRAKEAMGLPVL